MTKGTVKWFNPNKGFGFIVREDGGEDVFVHISDVERAGLDTLLEGQKVQFELKPGQKGKSQATGLSKVWAFLSGQETEVKLKTFWTSARLKLARKTNYNAERREKEKKRAFKKLKRQQEKQKKSDQRKVEEGNSDPVVQGP